MFLGKVNKKLRKKDTDTINTILKIKICTLKLDFMFFNMKRFLFSAVDNSSH